MKTLFEVDKASLEVRSSHVFAATPERLFAAFTSASEIPKWWGPSYLKTKVDKLEAKIGGKWRFIQTSPDGGTHIFNGVYRELTPPTKLVYTFEYESAPGHILEETIRFEALGDGKTKVSSVSKYDNLEDLQGMVDMAMEDGLRESYRRLEQLTK